jgi:hypothetical protein
MAMLKILALGNRQIEDGRVQTAADVIARVRREPQILDTHSLIPTA